MNFNAKSHWEDIYKRKMPNEVSWTQEIPKSSIACRSISRMESVSASRIKLLVFGSICCQRSDWRINCLTKVFDSCIFLKLFA